MGVPLGFLTSSQAHISEDQRLQTKRVGYPRSCLITSENLFRLAETMLWLHPVHLSSRPNENYMAYRDVSSLFPGLGKQTNTNTNTLNKILCHDDWRQKDKAADPEPDPPIKLSSCCLVHAANPFNLQPLSCPPPFMLFYILLL